MPCPTHVTLLPPDENSYLNNKLEIVGNRVGYTPVRIMFYYPNRQQAMRIQQTLETLYQGIGGHYHYGDGAWAYVLEKTGIDLKAILEKIANERVSYEV